MKNQSKNQSLVYAGDVISYITNTKKSSKNVIIFQSAMKWYTRFWFVITNPIYYIFTGKIRY
jgi:hypothetical protein